MTPQELELKTLQTVSGYFRYNRLLVKRPNTAIEYEASLKYRNTLQEALENGLIASEEILVRIMDLDLWDYVKEERFGELPKKIEELKVSLYKERTNSVRVQQVRKELELIRTEYMGLFGKRHAYDIFSAEGYANFVKLSHIIRTCTFLGKKLYKFSEESLEDVISEYQKNSLGEDDCREICRNEPWLTYWTTLKSGVPIFGDTTDEQRKLIRISTFYDNLRSSPECPPDWVIEDNDMLDGYLISTRQEREKEEQSGDLESRLNPKVAGCSEIFVMCNDEETSLYSEKDVGKVNEMNGAYAKAIKKVRDKVIEEKGRVCEVDLPDQKRKVQMMLNSGEIG